jgi:acyl carrier protein
MPVTGEALRERIYTAVEEAYRDVSPEPSPVHAGASLKDDLALDSVQGFELLIRLEERFDIELVDEPILYQADTVDQLVTIVEGICRGPEGVVGGQT